MLLVVILRTVHSWPCLNIMKTVAWQCWFNLNEMVSFFNILFIYCFHGQDFHVSTPSDPCTNDTNLIAIKMVHSKLGSVQSVYACVCNWSIDWCNLQESHCIIMHDFKNIIILYLWCKEMKWTKISSWLNAGTCILKYANMIWLTLSPMK